jgi:hypothetical protein
VKDSYIRSIGLGASKRLQKKGSMKLYVVGIFERGSPTIDVLYFLDQQKAIQVANSFADAGREMIERQPTHPTRELRKANPAEYESQFALYIDEINSLFHEMDHKFNLKGVARNIFHAMNNSRAISFLHTEEIEA